MIIEELKFVLQNLFGVCYSTLKCAKCVVYPYPNLVNAGWSHTEATILMTMIYATYLTIFVVLWQEKGKGRW